MRITNVSKSRQFAVVVNGISAASANQPVAAFGFNPLTRHLLLSGRYVWATHNGVSLVPPRHQASVNKQSAPQSSVNYK